MKAFLEAIQGRPAKPYDPIELSSVKMKHMLQFSEGGR
jgi:hypothetical protein